MPDIASVVDFIKSELGEFNWDQSHVDLLQAWIVKSKPILNDPCDLIESESEEERARLRSLLQEPFIIGHTDVRDWVPYGTMGDSVISRPDVVAEQERITREYRDKVDGLMLRNEEPMPMSEDHECER